jgi:hypothetical protein
MTAQDRNENTKIGIASHLTGPGPSLRIKSLRTSSYIDESTRGENWRGTCSRVIRQFIDDTWGRLVNILAA